jgi:hypothetical protein
MEKIKSIALCAALVLALSIASAQSASARRTRSARSSSSSGTVLVLKAAGQPVPENAIVHVTAPSYFFKTKVTVEGTSKKAAKEEEVECESEFFEQGRLRHDAAANAWHVVEPAGIDFCEGEEWFEGHAMTHKLTVAAPNVVTDESTVELFRTEEQIKNEEKQEFEHEEPIHAREPRRCVYKTQTVRGHFKSHKEIPLMAKAAGKMVLSPAESDPGCFSKAKWKGLFTMTYQNQPIVPSMQ